MLVPAQDLMKADFAVFRDLLQRIPWEMVLGSFAERGFGMLMQAALGDSSAAVSRGSHQLIFRGAVQPQKCCALVLACIKNRLKEYWRMNYPGLFLEPRKSQTHTLLISIPGDTALGTFPIKQCSTQTAL